MKKITLTLVNGYSSSGKDSFCIDPSLFEIISKSDSLTSDEISLIFESKKKFAFADAVKDEIYPHLFPNIKKEDYSFISREEKEKYRNIIIEYAQKRKEEDYYYWAKIVESQILLLSEKGESHFFISDWRFPEELEYLQTNPLFKIYTVRVKSNYVVESKYTTDKLLDKFSFDLIVKWKE